MFRLTTDLGEQLRAGHTLLVPTRARLRAVELAYAAAQLTGGVHVWASADLMTPAGWARRECAQRAEDAPAEWPRILSATAEWLLWREAAREAARDLPFPDPDTLAESLQRASELAAEYGVRPAGHAADSEARLLCAAQRIFAARCRELGAASVSALTQRLREVPPARRLLVRGFAMLSPWLATLAGTDAGQAQRAPASAVATPRGVRTADADAQMEAIAAWCLERLARQPDARLLVMLPGSAGARERLAALISASLDPGAALGRDAEGRARVGTEVGAPLGSLALPAQALLGLAVLTGARLDPELFSRWLTSPYWGAPAPGAAPRAALALMLRERASASLNLRELFGALRHAPQALARPARELEALIRQAAARLGEGSTSPRRWSERFETALAALTWPGALLPDSALQQTRLRWRELLEEFGELAASVGSLGRDAALELLRALAQRTPYGAAEADVAVTLSPMLADPVVLYDGIWVGSLSADVLPQPVAPDPFLPLHAQLEAGVPQASAAGRRVEAGALMTAWRTGTADLVLSVPARDEDLELLPSPWLAGMALEDLKPRSLWLPLALHRDGCTEALVDVRGTAFNREIRLPSGTQALTLQNACPFRAYAELRLGAAAPEPAEPGVPMDQRGRLLHAALQKLWERLRDSRALGALAADALDGLIGECVTHAAQMVQDEQRRGRRRARRVPEGQIDLFAELPPALARECRRARGLIRRLCELECTRTPFAVAATEYTTELALGCGRVRMRLDRVDVIAGRRAVLDYKSGRPGSPDWYGERPTHPQLLAYLTALGSDVSALATVNLTAREVRFSGVAAAGGLLPRVRALPAGGPAAGDWAAQQRSWAALIERLIRGFLAGDARVDPAPGACEYCHITDICRIGAHLSPETPAHADEADE